jgi:nucleoid-associated protein YgaU
LDYESIKKKIEKGINAGADKFLSSKVKDELGLNKPTLDSLHILSQSQSLDNDLNTFFKPINSNFVSSRDYKNIQTWSIVIISALVVILLFLFFILITPHKDYSNSLKDTEIIVNGNKINSEDELKEKISQPNLVNATEEIPEEDLKIENIPLAKTDSKELAKKSPLVQKPKTNSNTQTNNISKSNSSEYRIRSGDTLEIIANKFYGNSNPSSVDKIKVANKIRDVRLLQIGQKIIIPQ